MPRQPCRRNSVAEILSIVSHVAQVLPGLRLHLFGVKLAVLHRTGYLPEAVVSVDSAAWTSRFGRHITVSSDEQRRTCRRCRLVAPRSWSGAPTRCPKCGGQLGVTQREYGLLVALPRYQARLERVLLAKRPIAARMGRVRLTGWGVAAAELHLVGSVISDSPTGGNSPADEICPVERCHIQLSLRRTARAGVRCALLTSKPIQSHSVRSQTVPRGPR